MKSAFFALALLHAALHLLGFAKGLHLAHIPQLQLPISRAAAWAWLGASVLITAGVALAFAWPRYWGIVMLAGLLVSQWLIFKHYQDAKFGTVANVLLLLPCLVNALDLRPSSLRSEYERATERLLVASATRSASPPGNVTDAELERLPHLVQSYLRRVGVVGKPHIRNMRAHMNIQIRRSPDEAWLDGAVEQYSGFDPETRFFFMQAKRGLVSFDVAHLFDENGATMRARVLGLFPVMEAKGDELTRSETVTLLNDMCFLAPASLLTSRLEWKEVDASHVQATLSHGSHEVSATLEFNAEGDLVNFVSYDRSQSDGTTSERFPWWTPVSDYRDFGEFHLFSAGEAQWEEPRGQWTYAKIRLLDVVYNVGPAQ